MDNGNLTLIGEIATEVAHEMRIPLTAIKNSIYYLHMAGVEDRDLKASEHIALINEKIDMCVRMLTNMQCFVQPLKPIRKESRIAEILTESLTHSLADSRTKITTQFEKNLPFVMLDPFQIRTVFDNIIKNAAEAMNNGGTLDISVKIQNDYVVVEFKDGGPGIAPENLDKIFTPMFSTTPHNIGIGLTICRRFVEAHKGLVEVESGPGKGTLVRVKLPLS